MIRKKYSLLLLLLLAAVCLSGCAGSNYRQAIRAHLKEKYGCDFVIVKAGKAFNGYDGVYVRAVCHSKSDPQLFEVCCYPDAEDAGERISLGGQTYAYSDDFADILFAAQLRNEILAQTGTDAFVQCQLTFSDHFLTETEYQSGLGACLNDETLRSHVAVYVVVRDEAELDTLRAAVEDICLGYQAYRQYLYFAVAPETAPASLQAHFERDPFSYDQYLQDSAQVEKVFFTAIHRGEGITRRSVEKG